MGPAPTREPRIALPPEATTSPYQRVLSTGETGDESQHDDACSPDKTEYYGDAVEVALGNTRCTEVGRHSTSEHIGKPATATAVKKYEQCQQETCDPKNDLQYNLEDFHAIPFSMLSNFYATR
jgi:hypothetical protein